MEFFNRFPDDDPYAAEYVDTDLSPDVDETEQKIHKSILEAGEHTHPRFAVAYYLNPVDKVIENVFVGGGMPRAAYYGIWIEIFTAPPGAIPQSVVNNLLAIEDRLIYDCQENFKGVEWDGRNHVGVWQNKPNYSWEYQFEIGCFWDPYDWFEPVLRDLKDKWRNGMTASQIIDSEDLGDNEGMVDRDDAIKWLEQVIEEWEEEEEEKED
jgi:hypothetical protein